MGIDVFDEFECSGDVDTSSQKFVRISDVCTIRNGSVMHFPEEVRVSDVHVRGRHVTDETVTSRLRIVSH